LTISDLEPHLTTIYELAPNTCFGALDEKLRAVFPRESVYKNPSFYEVFSGRNIPSFMKDWMIKIFTEEDHFDRQGCLAFLEEKVPQRGTNIRQRLLHSRVPIQVLSRLIVQTDLNNGKMGFSIPDLGIGIKEGVIPLGLAQSRINHLHEGEVWGILTLNYKPPDFFDKGCVLLSDFKPFQPYSVDLDYFLEARAHFTLQEWIDVLIRTMEFNPDYQDPQKGRSFDLKRKMMLLSRLLVYVEPNLNLIELAPKGTGKSYVFNNLSKYNWTVSGGIVTRAGLFYNIATRSPGIINNYDFLCLDEIETLQFSREEEMLGAFKNYLENGKIVVGGYTGRSDCGLIMLGNIQLDRRLKPRHRNYFLGLPQFFHSSAFIDRIHGFIEGWEIFRFNENLKVKGITLNVEYFSEIMHQLRSEAIYAAIVDDLLLIPHSADTRDTKAVKKLCTAYLKLLFPHLKSAAEISREDFSHYILNPAMQKRAIIRQQLSEFDPEFESQMPDIRVR